MVNLTDVGCGMGFGMGFFGWILMAIFWGAIIWLIIWLIRQNTSHTSTRVEKDSRAILKSRYAKGEITLKEYHEMKKELEEEE